MSKALPGVIVVLGVPIGMGVGAYSGHLTLGAVIGGCLGFAAGLATLLLMRKKPTA